MVNKKYFSEELAFSVASYSSYDKGKEYFKDGYVEKFWKEGDEYKAIVNGTHHYKVSLKFEGEKLIYNCSCPFELDGACKHIVAVILAFTSDKKNSTDTAQKNTKKNEIVVNKMLSEMTSNQYRLFLEKTFAKQPSLIEDLKIFLQGAKQTPVTVTDYKTQFRNELDQLDLKELLHVWYQESEDYYDDQYDDFATASLDDVVDEFIMIGKKYEENQNFGEALKIYQSIFEALSEKQKTIRGEVSDVSDWFGQEMDKIITFYVKILEKIDNKNLRKIGINFLCSVFQSSNIYISKEQVLKGLKQIIVNNNEAKYALDNLNFKKNNLSAEESSLLAFLYLLIEDYSAFENISLKNLNENASLTVDLLTYYQKNNNKDKILKISEQVLDALMKKDDDDDFYPRQLFNNKEIEIQIRNFLKNIYSCEIDYPLMITNLERLFLITGELTDYDELIKNYRTKTEKEKFWLVIKKHFASEYEIKTVFKVFKQEDQKQEILELIKKYPQIDCFPDMITFIRNNFPQKCFAAYQKKIEDILKVTKVEKYVEATYHLKKMKEIGLNKEFIGFISWIKITYWRRRKLLEELQNNQL